MLFSKPIADLCYEDVEEFCRRFRENIRVEYKSTFDDNVKRKLPKVLSSFANSYGGILIIGIRANAGVPVEPFEGIAFDDPEPRLTVENICRSGVFPEPVIYQQIVPSQIEGNAFLVVQVNESPRAPHAIENSTQVYVRTGDSANPTTLADVPMIERLLMRRREVLGRWEEFYAESMRLAEKTGLLLNIPRLELRIGPLYPTETLIMREKIFEFVGDRNLQSSIGFQDRALRHTFGAILSRNDEMARYLNIGELGTLHYLEPLISTNQQIPGERNSIFPFWWITNSVLRIIDVSFNLMKRHGISCNLRIEAKLENVASVPFTLSLQNNWLACRPVITLTATVPASTVHSSETLATAAQDVTVELLYQLRWPFGKDKPHTREEIRPIVANEHQDAGVK